jgi:hypothetical protein
MVSIPALTGDDGTTYRRAEQHNATMSKHANLGCARPSAENSA